MTTPTRRVLALAPMPPEKSAYALARYSRSPDSIEESLRWVHGHSSEKFWEQFYFDYGHASIADLGHVIICFEGISELAAIHIEDETLWDGQAKSSRYQDFGSGGMVTSAEPIPCTPTARSTVSKTFLKMFCQAFMKLSQKTSCLFESPSRVLLIAHYPSQPHHLFSRRLVQSTDAPPQGSI